MKKQISVKGAFLSIILSIIIAGCGEQAEQAQTGADPDTQEQAVDLSIEVPLLKVGHCMHDHHTAVLVYRHRGARMNAI